MKIAVISPDGIGDFILRIPLLQQLEKSGHELLLCAQPGSLEVAKLADLKARPLILNPSPYAKDIRRQRRPYRDSIREIVNFGAARIFLAPFQPTFFEESLVESEPGLSYWGFESVDDFWAAESVKPPREISKHYRQKIFVSSNQHESEKLDAAWQKLSGENAGLPDWRFAPSEGSLAAARTQLGKWDLQEKQFILVCAGYRRGDHFKGWGQSRWADGLKALADIEGLRYLFVGSPGESEAASEIHAALGGDAAGHRMKVGEIAGLADLAAILALSRAYVGKDTSTLHLAAGLGLPFVAIFGGGMWPRFVPRTGRGVALTAQMPCQGCNWRCHLPEPGCVVDLTPEDLVAAWQQLPAEPDSRVRLLEKPYSGKWSKPSGETDWLGYSRTTIEQRHKFLMEERERWLREWWTLPRIRNRLTTWIAQKVGR